MYNPDFEVAKTLDLKKSLHYAGDEIPQLHFREPEAEMLDVLERSRKAKKPQSDTMVVLSWLTGIGIPSLRRLSWRDTQEALEIIAELTEGDYGDNDTAATEPWEEGQEGEDAVGKNEGSG